MTAHLIYKTVAGSRLYGTSRPQSDYDFRGVAIEPLEGLIGLSSRFEQAERKEPDEVIWGLGKFLRLALENNPNILDMLFAPQEHWITAAPAWEYIYDQRHDFLSTKVRQTYVGYAVSQLKRMKRDEDGEFARLKHAAHLVRLLLQVESILKEGDFTPVLSGNDLTLVRSALTGEWPAEEIIIWTEEQKERVNNLPSALPEQPQTLLINQITMDLYQGFIGQRETPYHYTRSTYQTEAQNI